MTLTMYCTQDSVTALHLAAYGGSIKCVEYLLPLFGDTKFAVDEIGWTCLHFALGGGSVPVTRYLVDQCGFDLGLRTATSYGKVCTDVHYIVCVYALMHGWT